MKIAILFSSEQYQALDKNIVQAVIINIADGKAVDLGRELLSLKNHNYVSLWLLSKNIKELYAQKIDMQTQLHCEKLGISIKSLDDVINNPLLKHLLV